MTEGVLHTRFEHSETTETDVGLLTIEALVYLFRDERERGGNSSEGAEHKAAVGRAEAENNF